jgi:hypothetical protein
MPPVRFALCVTAALFAQLPVRAADPFETLNEAFRQQHAEAREREWSRRGPVILVEFEKLTLINGDERKSAEVIPTRYHQLKSVAHAPFAIYLALEGVGDGPLDDRQKTLLKDFVSRIDAVRTVLGTADFSPETLARQREILDHATTFIANTLKSGSASSKEVKDFASGVRPLLLKNVEEAAELQIRAYDRQIALWKQSFPRLDWGRMKVVITGSALPRKQNLATQYFARLLGVSGEGPRIVYAESLYDEPKALKLLNATTVDTKAGEVIFDDPTRLHRDLMAEATATFLREHGAELRGLTGAGHP